VSAPADPPTLRGLLVDYGGVLTTDVFVSFAEFCRTEGIDPDTVRRRFRADPGSRELLAELECGRIAEADFEQRFAEQLGVEAPGLIERLFRGARAEEAMFTAVRAARAAGVRTGLISNSWGNRGYDRGLLPELFDGVVISGDVGIRKPDPRMYELGAEAIGLKPDACAYVDDLPGNLKPARVLGMTTIHHRSAHETIAELEGLLDVPLR